MVTRKGREGKGRGGKGREGEGRGGEEEQIGIAYNGSMKKNN